MKYKLLLSSFVVLVSAITTFTQTNYSNFAQLSSRLTGIASKSGGTAAVSSIGKSKGGKDLWLLTLGKGDATKKPAILIVAGIEASHLAGTEIVVLMAEKMLASAGADSVAKLLETKTFYFIPSVNPDAQEQFSAKPKFERSGNATETDDDRDGKINEDPFEDLNNDGVITMLRVEDPTGTFVVSKDDARVLVKADPAKGEVGKYLIMSEGTDNDKDGAFNEDGVGGVNPDKNFTFDYPIFVTGSGEYAASESETRALLDFLYKSPNIFAVITFGPANNLTEAPKFDPSKVMGRIVKGPLQKDATAMEQVSKLYNSRTGLKDAPTLPQTKGNFSQTAYYHAGRLSFTTSGWWVPKIEAAKDTSKSTAQITPAAVPQAGVGRGAGGRMGGMMGAAQAATTGAMAGEDDIKFLKWADKEKLAGAFVNWTAIQHPDFPNQKVEVGGIAPFAKINPPVSYLKESADKHFNFLTGLGKQMPEIELVNIKNESLGGGVSRITATILNKGLLPTYSEMGDKVRFVQKVKTELKLATGQTIVSGRRLNLRPALGAGEKEEYSWLVSGVGKLIIEAGCATAGIKAVEVILK